MISVEDPILVVGNVMITGGFWLREGILARRGRAP